MYIRPTISGVEKSQIYCLNFPIKKPFSWNSYNLSRRKKIFSIFVKKGLDDMVWKLNLYESMYAGLQS